ncbi:HAMP domain-containing histidine kinase [Paenibacillus sp. TRM 82003]|nr:HAMP domain-containing histidine kinase [Paenibacillus sp. TRM 82003]
MSGPRFAEWLKRARKALRRASPGTLRAQLLLRSLFILAAMLAVVGISQYIVMQKFLLSNQAETIDRQMESFPRGMWEMALGMNEGKGDADRMAARPMLFLPDASLAFVDLNGNMRVLVLNDEAGDIQPLKSSDYIEALDRRGRAPFYRLAKDELGRTQLVVLSPVDIRGRTVGIAQVSMPVEPLRRELMRQLLLFLALSAGALIAGLFAFLPVLRRTLIPLSRMIHKVERIDSGSLNERLPIAGTQAEIDRLSSSFNRMMERLETSFDAEREAKEQMRRFVADASHELRTPLTSIHGFLEVLLRGAAHQPDQLERALKSMYSESGRLNKLVRDLLLLARLDRTPDIQPSRGSLGKTVGEMESQLRMLAGSRRVDFDLDETAACAFDADKLKQVVLNLFQNAVQHTDPNDGVIGLSVRSNEAGEVALTVRDNGSGMEADHLQHIFERFYRVDGSRARIYGGAGLGLAITKSIVDLHGGRIRVASAPGDGTEFIVTLPADGT